MSSFIFEQALLSLVDRPAFYVQDNRIVQINEAARSRLICEGESISKYLPDIPRVYEEFQNGCLFLNLTVQNITCPACITRQESHDLFVLDARTDSTSRSLALAAIQLRQSLNTVYAAVEDIPPQLRPAHMNRALAQMHRVLCNMSDLTRYNDPHSARMVATNLTSVFTETMEKCQTLLAKAGFELRFTADDPVFSMADREMIERALWNMLSNAAKFSDAGSCLEATMRRSGNIVRFTVQDTGDGIKPEILQQIYKRYLREPSFEDSRHGMGLGLAIVSAVAGLHGGTVLIDQPEGIGTRVTLTITVKPCSDHVLRSPTSFILGDYCGGYDHGVLELSDILPAKMYETSEIAD
jgi:two-component sensor histidine kinase